MRVFNLAEELEKERKKNKELQEDVNKYVCYYRWVKEENKELKTKLKEIVERYDLGKYDYSIPPGGIQEIKDLLEIDNIHNVS